MKKEYPILIFCELLRLLNHRYRHEARINITSIHSPNHCTDQIIDWDQQRTFQLSVTSIIFESTTPHRLINKNTQRMRAVWVVLSKP